MKNGILTSALALALSVGAGCNSRAESLCNDICDCEGCSDTQYESCVDDADDLEREIVDEGCGDELDVYYDCIVSEQECNGSSWSADGCTDEAVDVFQCCEGRCVP